MKEEGHVVHTHEKQLLNNTIDLHTKRYLFRDISKNVRAAEKNDEKQTENKLNETEAKQRNPL